MRTQVDSDSYASYLLCSKSRVVLLKAVSLPRLELSAALLLSRLSDKIKSAVNTINMSIWLWSDSIIALNGIVSPSRIGPLISIHR